MSLSTFSRCWLAVEFLLLAFHFSVFVCITRQLFRKSSTFATAFYKLYALRSLADYGAYAAGSLIMRMVNEEVFSASRVTEGLFVMINFVLFFSVFLQSLIYLTVAANRYTALIHPMRHQTLWRRRSFAAILTVVLSSSFLCAGAWVFCGYVSSFVNDTVNIRAILLVDTLAVIIPTLFGSAFLEVQAFRAYFRLDKDRKRQFKDDYLLLVYASINFTMPVTLAVLLGINTFTWDPTPLSAFVLRSIPLIIDFLSFSEPVWLMAFCRDLRRCYVATYFAWRRPSVVVVARGRQQEVKLGD